MSVRNRPLPRRQPRRQPPWLLAVLLPVVALVIVGVVFGVVTLLHSGGSSATPEPTASAAPCLPAPTAVLQPLPDPTEVSVNVYNATPTKGLAAQTAKELKTRGFTIKAVGNDPKKMPISSVAELRFGPKGQARAELLQYYFPGAELINDGRRGKLVDVAIGSGFTQVPAQPDVTDQIAMRTQPVTSASGCAIPPSGVAATPAAGAAAPSAPAPSAAVPNSVTVSASPSS